MAQHNTTTTRQSSQLVSVKMNCNTVLCLSRFLIWLLFFLYTALFPVFYYLTNHMGKLGDFMLPKWSASMYIIAFNLFWILAGGKYLVSTIAFPYSNFFFSRHLRRTTNQRFGTEFDRCIDRMVKVIRDAMDN